jgi:type I restriction-modification system, specificity subunit
MAKLSSSNGLEKRPKLRFPEFKEPYRSARLGEIAVLINRTDPKSAAPIMMLSAGNGFIMQSDKYSRYNAGQSLKKYILLKKGELAYNHGASKAKQFGCCYELLEDEALIPYVYHCFKVDKNEYTPYVAFLLNNPKIDRQLKRLVSSSARMDGLLNISFKDYMSINLSLPPYAEQKQVSDFIKRIDERIVIQEQLISSLKKYKRGLINEILSERVKLSADKWITCRIGDFLCPKSVKQLPSEDAPLMAFTSTSGVCEKGERYDRGFLVKDVTTKMYKRTDYGDFIYSSNNIDVGSIGLNLYGAAVISDVYEIFSIRYADPWFISETIQQKKVIHNILKYRQGCLYGQYRIYAEDFMSVHIRVPTLNIQKKIGSIFSQINRRITSEQNLLYWLEKIRASLLQQLFI